MNIYGTSRVEDAKEVSCTLGVCNDRLDDGKYEDILNLVVRSEAKVPVIVVSQTGDWPDTLRRCVAGHLTFWLTPLSLRTFNGPSKMPCWGDSGTSKRTKKRNGH
jgi:hypothetical protein